MCQCASVLSKLDNVCFCIPFPSAMSSIQCSLPVYTSGFFHSRPPSEPSSGKCCKEGCSCRRCCLNPFIGFMGFVIGAIHAGIDVAFFDRDWVGAPEEEKDLLLPFTVIYGIIPAFGTIFVLCDLVACCTVCSQCNAGKEHKCDRFVGRMQVFMKVGPLFFSGRSQLGCTALPVTHPESWRRVLWCVRGSGRWSWPCLPDHVSG